MLTRKRVFEMIVTSRNKADQVSTCQTIQTTGPLDYRYSSDSDGASGILDDTSRKPHKILVDMQGNPAEGVIDRRTDMTIIGSHHFKRGQLLQAQRRSG